MEELDLSYRNLIQKHIEKIDEFRRSKETSVLVVMFTDLKGSTRIAEERGERYAQGMRHIHDEMLLEIIERDGRGLYIRGVGDSILCVFSEPSVAVDRALEIQRKLHQYNQEHPDEEPIRVRIGMHMGQVSVEDRIQTDVFGRHVNRAARVESLADGGQVLFTHGVYDSARGWVEDERIAWKDHGEYLVKGIPEPVRIYEAADPEITSPKPPQGVRYVPRPHRLVWGGAVAAGCLILGLSILLWMTWRGGPVGVPSGRPVIAVMYFSNLSGNEAENALCAGMTETLITDLARLNGLAVVPRDQVLKYLKTPGDGVQAGRELGAYAVLEGSLQRVGNRVRVNTQLVDVSSGSHLWAERFDQTLENLFALQDTLSSKIIRALRIEVSVAEASVLKEPATRNLDAYQVFSRGIYYFDREMYDLALKGFEDALRQDPTYTVAAFWKGQTLERMKRWKEALATYRGILPESGKEDRVRWRWTYPADIPEATRGSTQAPDTSVYLYGWRGGGKTLYFAFDPIRPQVSLKLEVPGIFAAHHQWIGDSLMVAGYIGESGAAQKLFVYGVDLTSGRVRWRFRPQEYAQFGFEHAALKVRDKSLGVLDPMRGSEIYVLDGPSGKRLWTYPIERGKLLPFPFFERAESAGRPPVILLGRRLGSSLEGRNAHTGAALWRKALDGDLLGIRAKGDRVYVLTSQGVQRIDAHRGDALWSQKIPALVRRDPASISFIERVYLHDQRLLCLAAADGTVYGIDLENGRIRWRIEAGKEFFFNFLSFSEQEKYTPLQGDVLFLTSEEGDLLGVDVEEGKVLLHSKVGEGRLRVDVASDSLLFARSGRAVFGLDRRSGAVRWQYDGAYETPFLKAFGNQVFFPSGKDALSVLDAGDGARLWTYLIRPIKEEKEKDQEEGLRQPHRLVFRNGRPFLIDAFGVVELNTEGFSRRQAVMEKQVLDRMARCHRALGELNQALAVARRVAQEVAPGFADAYQTLGDIYRDMRQEVRSLDAYMTYYSLIDVGRDQARQLLANLKDRAGLLWKKTLKGSPFIPIFRVHENTLVIASGNLGSRTTVYGLDVRDGSIRWEQVAGGYVALSRIVEGNSIIGVTQEERDRSVVVWRMNVENGQRLWTRTVASPEKGVVYWFSEPLLAHDRVFVAVNRREGLKAVSQYLCLDLDGDLAWQREESTEMSPLSDAGHRNLETGAGVVVAGWRDTLRAYNPASGEVLWTEVVPSPLVPDFVADGDRLFFETQDHQINAFDVAARKLLWRSPLPGEFRSLTRSRIYSEIAHRLRDNRMLTWDEKGLYALAVEKGITDQTALWEHSLSGRLAAPPRIEEDAVYALLSDNTLLTLDARSGKERSRRSLLWKAQNFEVAGDKMFLLSEDSDLYALSLTQKP